VIHALEECRLFARRLAEAKAAIASTIPATTTIHFMEVLLFLKKFKRGL
jgi:hypothetical protein